MPQPLLLAHRGDRSAGPENSARSVLAAFLRCDGAEVDVIVTADGEPILRHDDRLASGVPVRSLSLAEVRRLTGTADDDCPHAGDLLAALTRAGATGLLDVELKVPGAARALLPYRAHLGLVAFTSFFATEVLDALALFPERPAGLLCAYGVPRFVPPGASFLAIRQTTLEAVRAAHPTMPLYAWTLNDAEAVVRARAVGAAVWIGDDVGRLRAWRDGA